MEKKLPARRWIYDRGLRALLWLCGGLVCALLVFIIGYIFARGLPRITWELLSTQSSVLRGTVGILPHIASTVYIILVSMVIVLPLGVGAAIYLTEYATNRRLAGLIEFAAETLTGIPSIIYGLVGMMVFLQLMGLKAGILAGGLTLVVMILPTIIRTTQESLKTVPQSYREGVLYSFAQSLNNSSATLTVALYLYANERGETEIAFAIAAILMILTLIINLAAGLVGRRLKK